MNVSTVPVYVDIASITLPAGFAPMDSIMEESTALVELNGTVEGQTMLNRHNANDQPRSVINANKDFINYVRVNPKDNEPCQSVPVLMCTNVRSAFPKIGAICHAIIEENIDICILSEIWMDSTNPLHVNAIDRELEINGLLILGLG